MRRVAAIFPGKLRVEIAGEKEALPLAVVVSRPGGAVQTERDVLGNTRIDVASAEARAFGVRTGQTVAAARAKCAQLRVKVVGSQAVHAALVRIAESMLAFGPAVSFDALVDVIWVEVGGCAHLHGGEEALARAILARVREQGHACSVAVANGPRIAAAVARFAPRARARRLVWVVPEGEEARAMRMLPVSALAFDDDVMGWLSGLGLRTCGDLQKLPRRALGTRLGVRAHDVMQLLDGEDLAPLEAHRPVEVPEEQVDLEWGAPTIDSLVFVLTTLCERLSARLEGRAMGAGRVELVLRLDRALCEGESPESRVEVVLPAPIRGARELFSVVRASLDGHSIAAPVLSLTLRALDLAPMTGKTRDLLSPEPRAARTLLPLVAELSAELGSERVGTLSLVDTWVPDERGISTPRFTISALAVRPAAKRSGGGSDAAPAHTPQREARLVTSALEPTRLVPPACVAREAIDDVEILARVDGVQWWRRDVRRRDLAAAWLSGALAWLQIEGDVQLRGWVD